MKANLSSPIEASSLLSCTGTQTKNNAHDGPLGTAGLPWPWPAREAQGSAPAGDLASLRLIGGGIPLPPVPRPCGQKSLLGLHLCMVARAACRRCSSMPHNACRLQAVLHLILSPSPGKKKYKQSGPNFVATLVLNTWGHRCSQSSATCHLLLLGTWLPGSTNTASNLECAANRASLFCGILRDSAGLCGILSAGFCGILRGG